MTPRSSAAAEANETPRRMNPAKRHARRNLRLDNTPRRQYGTRHVKTCPRGPGRSRPRTQSEEACMRAPVAGSMRLRSLSLGLQIAMIIWAAGTEAQTVALTDAPDVCITCFADSFYQLEPSVYVSPPWHEQ